MENLPCQQAARKVQNIIKNPFPILFQDDDYVAINKPSGILVHKTNISEDTTFVLQGLRDQIKQRIYPVHRLDRGTSGVLIFGKNKEAAGLLGAQFRLKTVNKTYWAIIRGFVEASGIIDYPIASEKGKALKKAITHFKKIDQTEINQPVGRYPTARYTLIEAKPETGRFHQIRKHFAHLRHPVIGDKKHGDVKHNKFFKNTLELEGLLLHCLEMQFEHPFLKEGVKIEAPLRAAFEKAIQLLFNK